MSNAGFGIFGVGNWATGFGQPANAIESKSVPFPLFDGLLSDGRGLSWITGDYIFDSDGRIVGMPAVQQKFALAFLTQLGSSVLPTLGNDLASIKTITADIRPRIVDVVRRASSPLVSSGAARVESVDFAPQLVAGRIDFRVLWRDLTSGNAYRAEAFR